MNSTNTVVANAMAARNATYKLSSAEAKVGDKVKVAGAIGTYVVTKVDGKWVEIKDADDGTPQGRVEARFATPVRNAAPKGLTPTTKLRLKEDFSDEYGSYRKGDVFQMYAMGGINPRFGTMMVPGRGVTLQIPWEKLEVVNAVARNAGAYDVAARAGNLFKDAYDALAGCAANLEKLTTLGQPDDVPGNDSKIASWAKDKARKVRDIMNKLDQGRL